MKPYSSSLTVGRITRSPVRCVGCTPLPERSCGRQSPRSSTRQTTDTENEANSKTRNEHNKEHWSEQRVFDQRAIVAGAMIVLLTLGLLGRLFLLQVIRHDYYAELSQGNRVRTEPIPAARGLILDRHGEVVAGNQPSYQLELVPEEVPNLHAALDGLAQLDLIRAEDVDELKKTI